jgi:hypothetical protein
MMQAERKELKKWVYSPGDMVYVIDRWYENKPTGYIRILQEQVKEVSIQIREDGEEVVEYYFDGYLEAIHDKDVDADFFTLVTKMKKEWDAKQ